jgi:hypothetical protein
VQCLLALLLLYRPQADRVHGLLAAALISLLLLADPPRLTVTTHGRIAFAPADWWVRVRVEPHPDNRWLDIVADGDGQYRHSGFPLEGEQAPKIHQIWLKALPEGCYEFTATLRATGEFGKVLVKAKGQKLGVRGFTVEGDPCGGSVDAFPPPLAPMPE